MITVDNNKNITMTRGDTFVKVLTLTKNGSSYTPQEGDDILFTMAKGFKDTRGYEVVLQKHIPTDTLIWQITANETKDLDYGIYNYDLQMTYADGTVETFASERKIELTKEVG